MIVPIIKDDIAGGQALAAGQVDWKYSLTGPTYEEIKTNPDLQFVEYPDFGFFSLYFNNRPGTLFADKRLRQAFHVFTPRASICRCLLSAIGSVSVSARAVSGAVGQRDPTRPLLNPSSYGKTMAYTLL